ncbi:MAG: hypothetical protein [Caudoviricetes sp.]|nr:MAG: hypothetical protein [Caudoviricetes sp.]
MIKISGLSGDKNLIVKDVDYSGSLIKLTLRDGRVFIKENASVSDANFALNDSDVAFKKWFGVKND